MLRVSVSLSHYLMFDAILHSTNFNLYILSVMLDLTYGSILYVSSPSCIPEVFPFKNSGRSYGISWWPGLMSYYLNSCITFSFFKLIEKFPFL